MTKVTSSSALVTLTVPSSLLQKDTLLHVIVKLASPLQLTLKETNKATDSSMTLQLFDKTILTERNAIVRCLAGSGLHHALDHSPLLLLGGHSITAKASPVSAMAMAGIASWQAIADSFRNEKEEPDFLQKLNTYLETRAFLIPSAQCTVADMDLALALCEVPTTTFSNVSRWRTQVYAVLFDYGSRHGIVIPTFQGPPAPTVTPMFYYGTETFVPAAAMTAGTTKPANTTHVSKTLSSSAGGEPEETPGGGLTEEQKKAAADKRVKKAAEKKKETLAPPPPSDAAVDISALDIRVGKISKVWHHPEAEKLFCEEVHVGEDQPRMIASGLRPFYATSDLENRMVVVLCNLKARNLVGFSSHGMVLCASNEDHTNVKLVVPPQDAPVGERITFHGLDMKPPEAENKVAKKKMFEGLAPFLKTNGDGQVVWKEFVANTSAGPLTCELVHAHVS